MVSEAYWKLMGSTDYSNCRLAMANTDWRKDSRRDESPIVNIVNIVYIVYKVCSVKTELYSLRGLEREDNVFL